MASNCMCKNTCLEEVTAAVSKIRQLRLLISQCLGNLIGKLSSQNRLEIHSKLCHDLKVDIYLELDQTLNHKSIISVVVVECMVNICKLCKRSEEQARNSISTLQYDPF